MNLRLVASVGLLVLFAFLTGCASPRKVTTPIPHQDFHVEESNRTLVVLLPGRGDDPDAFLKNGTIDEIRRCNPEANIVGVDSHLGYYTQKKLADELRQNIIGPALETNVEEVWLMGVSLGGMGSLIYRKAHPADLKGVILMAPYLGEWKNVKRFMDDAEVDDPTAPPFMRVLWQHIVTSIDGESSITLAFGKDDRFSQQQEWLAGYLNEKKVIRGSGGHSWKTWEKLWPRAIKASGFCQR